MDSAYQKLEAAVREYARAKGAGEHHVALILAYASTFADASGAELAADGLSAEGLSAGQGLSGDRLAQRQRVREWSGRQLSAVETAADEPDQLDRRVPRPAGADQDYPTSGPRWPQGSKAREEQRAKIRDFHRRQDERRKRRQGQPAAK
jgi:hypothetical protein